MSIIPRDVIEDLAGVEKPTPEQPKEGSRHDNLRDVLWKLAGVVQQQEAFDVALALGERWDMTGREDEIKRLVRDTYAKCGGPVEKVEFSDLADLTKPEVSETKWFVQDLFPERSNVLIGAEKKCGKTWLMYSAFLQAAHGDPVFGHFDPKPDLKIHLWQFEMPDEISKARLRKACLGLGIDPAWPKESGMVRLISQPDLDLCDPADLEVFHRTVLDDGANLVLLDSIGEAFSDMDPNSNRDVRRFLKPALNPLTKAGVSTVLQHHKRKGQQGGGADDESDSILGAQSFQAKASRIYSMVRMGAETTPGDFVVRVRSQRGWDMTQTPEMFLHVRDTQTDEGTGTVVSFMSDDDVRNAKVETPVQRAERMLCQIVAEERLNRKALIERLEDDGVSGATAKRAYGNALDGHKIRKVDDGCLVVGRKWEP